MRVQEYVTSHPQKWLHLALQDVAGNISDDLIRAVISTLYEIGSMSCPIIDRKHELSKAANSWFHRQ
jgi:hypothetical protein